MRGESIVEFYRSRRNKLLDKENLRKLAKKLLKDQRLSVRIELRVKEPTLEEVAAHKATAHLPYQPWCEVCRELKSSEERIREAVICRKLCSWTWIWMKVELVEDGEEAMTMTALTSSLETWDIRPKQFSKALEQELNREGRKAKPALPAPVTGRLPKPMDVERKDAMLVDDNMTPEEFRKRVAEGSIPTEASVSPRIQEVEN